MIRLLVLLLVVVSCNSKRAVLRDLRDAESRASRIHAEASAAEGELGTAEPMIGGTGAESLVRSAKARQGAIQEEATEARNLLGRSQGTIENRLENRSRFPWWARWILGPIAAVCLIAFGISLLGSMGVPMLTGLAAWMARRGVGFGRRLADAVGRVVPGVDPDDTTTLHQAIDRMTTSVRSTAFGDVLWRQEQEARARARAATGIEA